MKRLLLLVLLATLSVGAEAQSRYRLVFGEDGKLSSIEDIPISGCPTPDVYPTVLYGDNFTTDCDSIKEGETSFSKSLKNFNGRLKAILPNQDQCQQNLLFKVKWKIAWSYQSLYALEKEPYLEYDDKNGYLPVKASTRNSVFTVSSRNFNQKLFGSLPTPGAFTLGDDRTEYQLTRQELDNQVLAKHLKNTAAHYRGVSTSYDALLKSIGKTFRQHGYKIDTQLLQDTLKTWGCCKNNEPHSFNPTLFEWLRPLQEPIRRVDTVLCRVLCDNEEWIKSWLWYTGGEVRLNPFPHTDPVPLLVRTSEQIQELEEELKILQTYVACCGSQPEPEVAVRETAFLLGQINELKRERDRLEGRKTAYPEWLAKHSVESRRLYSGVWHGSSDCGIRWLHQYDASDEFNSLTKSGQLPDMVASQDQVVVYVHNVKSADKLNPTAEVKPFVPKTRLEEELGLIADAFDEKAGVSGAREITSLLAGVSGVGVISAASVAPAAPTPAAPTGGSRSTTFSLGALKGRLQSKLAALRIVGRDLRFDDKSQLTALIGALLADRNDLSTALASELQRALRTRYEFVEFLLKFGINDEADYRILIQEYRNSREKLIWLLNQTTPIRSLTLKPLETPEFRTEVFFPEKKLELNSSNLIDYKVFLNDKKEPEVKRSYKKYEMVRFWPTIGVAYVFDDRSSSDFDASTGQFKNNNEFDNIEALVGVKWYFKRTNPARVRSTTKLLKETPFYRVNTKRGNAFGNTLFANIGLGVRHQFLRNYYAGVGADLIPGVSLQAGVNLIFQKRFELENGVVKKQRETPKPFIYVGLSFDPGIVTNLLRIF